MPSSPQGHRTSSGAGAHTHGLTPFGHQGTRQQDASIGSVDGGPGENSDTSATSDVPKKSLMHISRLAKLENTWILELSGLALSAAALLAIVIILQKYDGKPRPAWRISLNAVISVLSYLGSVGALYTITHGVSQLKWTWFSERERNLADLQVFDSASRGAVGAVELLYLLRARHLAALGAVAIVLRVGFDPFIQNVIQYRDGLSLDATQVARVARTMVYQKTGPLMNPDGSGGLPDYMYRPDPALKASVYTGLHGDQQRSASWPQHLCPTGNCTWDRFATMAFCPRCVDISKYVNHTCWRDYWDMPQKCNVSLPGKGPYLQYETSRATVGGGTDNYFKVQRAPGDGLELARIGPFEVLQSLKAAVNISVIEALGGTPKLANDTRMLATECAMLPCVLSIDAAVRNGVYSETVVDTFVMPNLTSAATLAAPPWGIEKGVTPGQSFGVTPEGKLVGSVNKTAQALAFSSDEMEAIFLSAFDNTTCNNPEDNFACAYTAVGRAMTKAVRDASMSGNATMAADIALGKAFVTTSFLRVEWAWMSLPALVWVIGLVVWLGTLWKTRRAAVPMWRDNALPMVFMEPPGEVQGKNDGAGTTSGAYLARAERLRVRLVDTGGEMKLVGSSGNVHTRVRGT